MNSTGRTATINSETPASQAIPALMDRHGGQIYGLALRLCGEPNKAEDLVQETFLQAFRKWDQFEGRSSPSTWLYTIAARMCQRMNRRRAGEPRRMTSLNAPLPTADGPVVDVPSPDEGPLHQQLRDEAREHLEHAITRMPESFRMPLILKDIVGFSVAEVADVLGLKEATIKTRLHRARHALRDELTRRLPHRDAPPLAYSKRVCMDLLQAKQEALDNGADFPMDRAGFCERCAAVFATMDLARDVCADFGREPMPEDLRRAMLGNLHALARA